MLKLIRKKIKLIAKFLFYKLVCPFFYWLLSKYYEVTPNKIVFIEPSSDRLTNSLSTLFNTLKKTGNFKVELFCLNQNRIRFIERALADLKLIKVISNAKLIFIDDTCITMGAFNLREETKLIQTWHACGPFKKFGWSTADLIFGGSRSEQLRYQAHKNYTFVTVGSEAAVAPYAEAFRLDRHKVLPIGISRTDVFFDSATEKNAREKLLEKIPQSLTKKVILYAPTFRGRVHAAKMINIINIELLCASLCDDYILLIKQHPFVKKKMLIPETCTTFAYDVSEEFSIDELLCLSDICITDYSSLIFEFSLFERPMIFFPGDIEKYQDWRGFYFQYDEFVPGPIVNNNFELLQAIKDSQYFDVDKVRMFKNKFMSACDGDSTSRILELGLGKEISYDK